MYNYEHNVQLYTSQINLEEMDKSQGRYKQLKQMKEEI